MKYKCGMAGYCRFSSNKYCSAAYNVIVDNCPYLHAIGEIARLSIENERGINMYNKKYYLEKIEEFGKHNFIYDNVEGSVCYLAYLNPGERGWFLYIEDDGWYEHAHRIHTSTIKTVEYVDHGVIVKTQNTKFTFVQVD